MSTTIKIPFATEAMGYDRGQVDRYVQKLADEYRSLQQKHKALADRFEKTYEDPANAGAPAEPPTIDEQAISKAMVDAEIKAIQIVTEAKNEAARVVEDAYLELDRVQKDKDRVVAEINTIIRRLTGALPTAVENRA